MTLQSCKYSIKDNNAIALIEKKAINNILVCAHRSFHTEAPENSLLSIKKAIKIGVDLVELDVRTTKDSILILMHDKTIDRTTTGKGKISDYTYLELQEFNLKIGDSVTEQKIPLVEDALQLLKNSECIANLDLKAVSYQQLYNLLASMDMQHNVISYIGKKKKVMEMLTIDSLYAILPLSSNKEDVMYYSKNTFSILQHYTDASFTPNLMELANKNGQLIFINTLWDEDDDFKTGNTSSMDSVIALRPAIIQTDYPQLLLNYLKEKDLHD
jgi:glycerophosphoryl diester phosphodiesterase